MALPKGIAGGCGRDEAVAVPRSPARIAERWFEHLDGTVVRLGAADVLIPYAPTLEEALLPNVETLVQALRRLAAY